MIEGCCDCGGLRRTLREASQALAACNGGVCRRAGALRAHGTAESVRVEGVTATCLRGDLSLAFHRCPACGVTTHWALLAAPGEEGHGRMAADMGLAAPEVVGALRIRHFDGAASRECLDGRQRRGYARLPPGRGCPIVEASRTEPRCAVPSSPWPSLPPRPPGPRWS